MIIQQSNVIIESPAKSLEKESQRKSFDEAEQAIYQGLESSSDSEEEVYTNYLTNHVMNSNFNDNHTASGHQ